jgi:hypothetical protein
VAIFFPQKSFFPFGLHAMHSCEGLLSPGKKGLAGEKRLRLETLMGQGFRGRFRKKETLLSLLSLPDTIPQIPLFSSCPFCVCVLGGKKGKKG